MYKYGESSGLFLHLETPCIKESFPTNDTLTMEPNSKLLISAQHEKNVYFILEGIICFIIRSYGKKKNYYYYNKHSIINDFIFFMDIPYKVEMQAVTPVILAKTNIENFKQLMNNPDFAREVVCSIGYKMTSLINQVSFLRFTNANQRVNQFIDDIQKFNNNIGIKHKLLENISQGEIADTLALHRVTVNKAIQDGLSEKSN